MSDENRAEPWLRGTLTDVAAVQRGVLHALALAGEDLERWCGALTDEELNARPAGLAPVAFHVRHIARSLDRLLRYAEGQALDAAQIAALKTEMDSGARSADVFAELKAALEDAALRVRKFSANELEAARSVGTKKLPTTLGGLLVHVADHTQRHVGQAIITAKVVRARLE
ncbi:MAG: DinB family protein [Candidatus Acidiferrales bacterium]